MYFSAEFPGNIDSQELYNDVKCFNLNVTDLITKTYMYGELSPSHCRSALEICYKYSFIHLDIKNPAD